MSSDKTGDDRAARKARADAIRRQRDTRNASLDQQAPDAPADTPSSDEGAETPPGGEKRAPNYVDFIDRKMRERKKAGREPTD